MIKLLTEEDDIDAIISGDADWWSYYPDEDIEEVELDKLGDTHKEAKSLVDELFDTLPDIDLTILTDDKQDDYEEDELEHQEKLLFDDCTMYSMLDDRFSDIYDRLMHTLSGIKLGNRVMLPSCLYVRFFDNIYKIGFNVYDGSFYITYPNENEVPKIVKSLI